jgi:precorrin-6Y C5,15-methyltransferase (decarboxylating)
MSRMGPRITIVGITDAGPASLPSRVLEKVRQAEVLCGGERHLGLFPDVNAERWVIKANIGELLEKLKTEAGKRGLVILASGDPLCYGIAATLRQHLPAEWLEVIPNVTAAQLAFARIGEPWHDAVIVSAHGRSLEPVINAVRRHSKVAVYTDDENTPAAIARTLLAAGISDRRAVVCEHLDGEQERLTDARLSELPRQTFASLNVLLLLGDASPAPPLSASPLLGVSDDEFEHDAGLITKEEVRAVALAKLRLREDSVVWDIGAGSGSVAIEAARLARQGQVYAVERQLGRAAALRRNVEKFRTGNVRVVCGSAPEALYALPEPDAVFVGGTGGEVRAIVDTCCARLRPGGRIVANFATLENLHEAVDRLKGNGFGVEITQVGIARSVPLAGLTRFEPLCPVFVVNGSREQR